MTAGGIDPLEQWQNVSYIPYDMMHRKWQHHLLKMLRENVSDPVVEKDIDRAWKDYPKGLVAFLQPVDVPPGGQGLSQYWQSTSSRRLSRFAGLKDMTVNPSATGTVTTKQDKLNTKPSLSSDSSDVWFSTSCQKDSIESVITDCTVMYVTKR